MAKRTSALQLTLLDVPRGCAHASPKPCAACAPVRRPVALRTPEARVAYQARVAAAKACPSSSYEEAVRWVAVRDKPLEQQARRR